MYHRLKDAGIQTKRYFYPPVHTQTAFQRVPIRVSTRINNTVKAGYEGLALPLYSHMAEEQFERVCRQVEEILLVDAKEAQQNARNGRLAA
jgi:dTDP-4-amino-4,6-dideoxygalactose transaminase